MKSECMCVVSPPVEAYLTVWIMRCLKSRKQLFVGHKWFFCSLVGCLLNNDSNNGTASVFVLNVFIGSIIIFYTISAVSSLFSLFYLQPLARVRNVKKIKKEYIQKWHSKEWARWCSCMPCTPTHMCSELIKWIRPLLRFKVMRWAEVTSLGVLIRMMKVYFVLHQQTRQKVLFTSFVHTHAVLRWELIKVIKVTCVGLSFLCTA